MNKLFVTLFMSLICCIARGDEDPRIAAFFNVTNSLQRYVWPEHGKEKVGWFEGICEDSQFLGALRGHRGKFTPQSFQEGYISGYKIDLNQDNKYEYFIQTKLGGSGGPHFFILYKDSDEWRIIGSIQGWFHTVPMVGQWFQLVVFSRGGGGHYSKGVYDYNGSEYTESVRTHIAQWD